MSLYERCWVVVLCLLIGFTGLCLFEQGNIKQKMILEKTGDQVSWFTAINYPDRFFTGAMITVKK